MFISFLQVSQLVCNLLEQPEVDVVGASHGTAGSVVYSLFATDNYYEKVLLFNRHVFSVLDYLQVTCLRFVLFVVFFFFWQNANFITE